MSFCEAWLQAANRLVTSNRVANNRFIIRLMLGGVFLLVEAVEQMGVD